MKEQKLFKLENGIRVVLVPVEGLRAVTVEVFFKIGSKYEKKDEYGISHFLEHMAFKGSQKRPSANDINSEIDSKGASYNAETSHETTSYHITTVKSNLSWTVEILSDILLGATYPKNEVLKERGVIAEEIKMYQDNPMMGLSGEFTEFMYGRSPIGCWNIAGEVEDVMSINREKIIKYKDEYFNPEETVIAIAGDIDARVVDDIKQYFESFEKKPNKLPEVEIVVTSDHRKEIKKVEIEQGHFCVGLPTLSRGDKRKYALKLLDLVLCGNTSSRLYNLIREEKGWAYYIFPISEVLNEKGFWAVQSGVKMDKLEEAVELSQREIEKIGETITSREITRAKDYMIGKMKIAMDRSDFWTSFIGRRLLLDGELVDLEKEVDKYRQVSDEEVRRVANEFFVKKELRVLTVSR
ncbi:MAG: M16 family metallopeptidase [Patescibacteria group bacterium]|jgi:predicted Zn-dependent peptidase